MKKKKKLKNYPEKMGPVKNGPGISSQILGSSKFGVQSSKVTTYVYLNSSFNGSEL
jgi:hypothetical protein